MFDNVKKNFGFGLMRLPMLEKEKVDIEQVKQMVDTFIDNGFNYFDTAHTYLNGLSEKAVKEALSSRYPRDKYILTNKLSGWCFKTHDDLMPLFLSQLDACGVEYFDFYLMHSQNKEYFKQFKETGAYDFAFELKKKGLVKHVGLSFHDTADVLDEILTAYPQFEVVQLQINYLDYEDEQVQGHKCYDVCVKHNKPVIVMEPVKGGNLVNLPDNAKEVFKKLSNDSVASYAIRYSASLDNVFMVLSGMSNMDQLNDNVSFMKDFKKLDQKEYQAIDKVCKILKESIVIPCTGCSYCKEECPKKINIPELFEIVNHKAMFKITHDQKLYDWYTQDGGKASECLKCGKCEAKCPQKIAIRKNLEEIAKTYEK